MTDDKIEKMTNLMVNIVNRPRKDDAECEEAYRTWREIRDEIEE